VFEKSPLKWEGLEKLRWDLLERNKECSLYGGGLFPCIGFFTLLCCYDSRTNTRKRDREIYSPLVREAGATASRPYNELRVHLLRGSSYS
jgi:hypothetical protein